MEKNLRKSYELLYLPISSTIEQVETREKALIKVIEAKEREKNISCVKEIEKVKISSELIIKNIKENGIPTEKNHQFNSSGESVFVLFLISVCSAIFCYFTFTLFL